MITALLLQLLQTLNQHCWSQMREKTRGAPSNTAVPPLKDCQDGDEPGNFGTSCGDG